MYSRACRGQSVGNSGRVLFCHGHKGICRDFHFVTILCYIFYQSVSPVKKSTTSNMYAGRRDITFAGLVLLIAVCCSTLNALTIPLPNLPPMRNVPFNITVGANEMLNVVVIPRNQKTVPQIQNVIDRTIRTGRATMVESAYIVEYRGVLFWSVKARDDEVEQMAQGLGTLVSNICWDSACSPMALLVQSDRPVASRTKHESRWTSSLIQRSPCHVIWIKALQATLVYP